MPRLVKTQKAVLRRLTEALAKVEPKVTFKDGRLRVGGCCPLTLPFHAHSEEWFFGARRLGIDNIAAEVWIVNPADHASDPDRPALIAAIRAAGHEVEEDRRKLMPPYTPDSDKPYQYIGGEHRLVSPEEARRLSRLRARENCPGCREKDGPSHDGSRRCESGSIASGGTRAHCTCDACF